MHCWRHFLDDSPDVAQVWERLSAVRDVVSRSRAEFAGLQVGDVILNVDGRAISETEEFKSIFPQMAGGQSVSMAVERTNRVLRIPVQATDWPQ
jgi:S1-C subfamily serine protease